MVVLRAGYDPRSSHGYRAGDDFAKYLSQNLL